jgi:hypothetical protein
LEKRGHRLEEIEGCEYVEQDPDSLAMANEQGHQFAQCAGKKSGFVVLEPFGHAPPTFECRIAVDRAHLSHSRKGGPRKC